MRSRKTIERSLVPASPPVEPAPVSPASPLQTFRLQTINLTVAGQCVLFPMYVSDASAMETLFQRKAGGTQFSIPAEAPVRLTQFGNRPSSKQMQSAYALKLRSAGTFRVTVETAEGRYGSGCFLCAQIYDAGHRFVTQVWTPLLAGASEQEFKVSEPGAHVCFAVQLVGSGQACDLSVRIDGSARWGSSGIEFETTIRAPEDVRALLDLGARGENALRRVVAEQQGLAVAAAANWFYDRRYHDILQLIQAVRPWREMVDAMDGVLVYLLFFGARSFANMNATRSAFAMLIELEDIEGWQTRLSKRDLQVAFVLHGHLLVRNGQPEDGLSAFNVARINAPTHWEAYFQLANNLAETEGSLKDAYYRAAETLLGHPHPKLAVAAVENDLRNGRWSDALSRALAAITGLKQGHDVWLALANVYLEIGDVASWRRYLSAYFEQHGLTAPQFERRGALGNELYAGITGPAPDRATAAGDSVAVIITTFNSEATLELAVASVLRQTYTNILVVIVDDRSNDRTLEIALRFAASDDRVRVIENDINCGTYTCKNLALAQIDADYFTFHDSDDWMHPERIATHIETMRETGAACTTSIWFRMNSGGRVTPRHAGGYQHSNPASIFVRKTVVDRIGYFDSVRSGADTEYVWRIRNLYGHQMTREIPLPLAIGLHHDASLTQSGLTAFDRHRFSEVRLDYWESWVRWHAETLAEDPAKLHLPFPLDERRFWAPSGITPEGGRRD